ncbi:MAG: abortive phage resistance protein [Gallionella sp.]|nr:MAG: abortive phage resistance protein [Gallionella sp.]
MNINASIVDQRLTGIVQEHLALIEPYAKNDTDKQRSVAFVLLCASTSLGLPLEEAAELLTEGGNDVGVDALHFSEPDDGEFTVTIFQGKYKRDLMGAANFPENGVKAAINMVGTLFDPGKHIQLNRHLAPRVEEIRSLIRDGHIPNVRLILCNNGAKWNDQAQSWIDQTGFSADQVSWVHFNHDNIVAVLQSKKAVDDSIQLQGKAVIEEFDFRRVLVGKVAITEIAELFNRHNDLLLERNIRRYLGLHANRVNSAIHATLADKEKSNNFYFFNNGITMICRKFRHNALQGESYQLKVEGIQIINGGQTCKTIQQTLNQSKQDFSGVYVLLRLYELADDDQDFVRDITYATNSQNPVDLRDLHSNDEIQKQLETGIAALGYTYKRQREEGGGGTLAIASTIVAEAVLAIWRKKPHQAKFLRREHFGKLYHDIFKDLNAAQAVLAVLIFRIVENERKRPAMVPPPEFLPYAAHYLAMLVGRQLLQSRTLDISGVDHRNFESLAEILSQNKDAYFSKAIEQIKTALSALYGEHKNISLQQLSATFRRGDLLENLGY